MIKTLIQQILNIHSGVKVKSKIEKIHMEYHILTDDSERMITRSRCHIKTYITRSGRVSKAPIHLIDQK